jgi:putative lipoic acid-binding regulatory protein
VEVKDRLGGKYASVSIEVVVRAPEMISSAYERIGQDGRVKMKF